MTTALETAFPLGANWLADVVRAKLAEAMIGVFDTPDLSAEDFSIQPYRAIAIGGPDGDLEFYAYDAGDTTTVDDGGVSCIVVSGRRYKKREAWLFTGAAISATTDAQPTDPAFGDTYILPVAPSGDDWAGHAKDVAIYTARGWLFREPTVGLIVHVEDDDAFWHFDANGDWTLGLGPGSLPDGSITPRKLFHPFAILKVVDQRNAPPGGTPTNGTMYQVGTSPSGAFVGHTNKIARWNGSAWEFIAQQEGDTIYRLDLKLPYTYRSGAWGPTIAASGVQQIKRYAFSGYSFGTVGNTIVRHPGIDFQSTTGKWLRIKVISFGATASGQAGGADTSSQTYSARLYADTSSTPLITIATNSSPNNSSGPNLSGNDLRQFLYQVPDSASHNYNVGIVRTGGSGVQRSYSNASAEIMIEELVVL